MPTHSYEMPILYYDGKPIGKITDILTLSWQSNQAEETYATTPQDFSVSFNSKPISDWQFLKIVGIRAYIYLTAIGLRNRLRMLLYRPQKRAKGKYSTNTTNPTQGKQ